MGSVGANPAGRRSDFVGATASWSTLELVPLCVVDVVAARDDHVVWAPARRSDRIGSDRRDVGMQRECGERVVRPVHVQQRAPERIMALQLHPFCSGRRGRIQDVHVGEVDQAEQAVAPGTASTRSTEIRTDDVVGPGHGATLARRARLSPGGVPWLAWADDRRAEPGSAVGAIG